MKTLIIGAGSIGIKHYKILSKLNHDIYFFTKRELDEFKKIKHLDKLDEFEYIIISNESNKHIDTLNSILVNNLKCKILVENPLNTYSTSLNSLIRPSYSSNIFVGYQLRFRDLINFCKNLIKSEDIFYIDFICESYLPNWNPDRDYSKTYSAIKSKGGGVLRDVSHEIDLLYYISMKENLINQSNKSVRISSLKIDTDDLFVSNGYIDNLFYSIQLNYFSYNTVRKIKIYSNNYTYEADLILNEIRIFSKNSIEIKKFTDNNEDALFKMHLDILNDGNDACKLIEGLRVTKWFLT